MGKHINTLFLIPTAVSTIGLIPVCLLIACTAFEKRQPHTTSETLAPQSDSTELVAISFPESIVSFGPLPKRIPGRDGRLIAGDTLLSTFISILQPRTDGGRGTPMRIDIRILSRDTTVGWLHYRPVAFAQCPVGLQLFHLSQRAAPAVWRSDAAQGGLSCAIASRDSSTAEAYWDVPSVLGDSLPPGMYFMATSVALADGRTFNMRSDSAYLSSDSRPPIEDRGGLRLSARSSVTGRGSRELRGRVVVVNPGSRSIGISYGGCTPGLNLYRDSLRKGSPVWRSDQRHPYVDPPGRLSGYACTLVLHGHVIPPRDSMVFSVSYPLREVIADSLPAGRYHVVALLGLGTGSSAKGYSLDAGAVYLAPAADTLPTARSKNGLTYVARVRVVRGVGRESDTVRTLVLVKNVSDARRELDIAADCPVLVDGYHAPLRLDLRELRTAFSGSRKCTGVPLYRFALEPGESWVFGQDVPTAEILKRAGPGRYWITAWIPGAQVQLGAGSVDIAT